MKTVRTIVSYLLSFVIICLILLYIAIITLDNKGMNKDYYYKLMEETEYYLQVSREVDSGFEDYIYQSGLPEDTLDNLVSDEKIRADINGVFESLFNEDVTYEISTEELDKELDARINAFLKTQNKTLTKEEKGNITKFEALISSSYKKNIKLSDNVNVYVKQLLLSIQKLANKFNSFPMVISIAAILILLIECRERIYDVIKYIGVSCLGAGIVIKAGYAYLMSKIDIDNVLLFQKSFTNLIQNIFKDISYGLSNIATGLIVGGMTLIVVYAIFRAFLKEKKEILKKA